jgi:DNA-binding response OmpR family regulator
MKQTILVVDDKKNVQQLLTEFLNGHGYCVNLAGNGKEALASIDAVKPDIILLDIMMPEMDGYAFIQILRKNHDLPVIMISAKQHESDLIKGFSLGADDYIIKPFRLSELLVRIKAVLRRSTKYDSITTNLSFAGLDLNKTTNEAHYQGNPIALTASEFCLLTLLVQCAEQTVNKADLCRYLIAHGNTGLESTLKIHIRNLRIKLNQRAIHAFEISSVFGIGYRLSVYEP